MLYMMAQHSLDLRNSEELFLIKVGLSRDTTKRKSIYKSNNPSALMIATTAGLEREESNCHSYLFKIGKHYSGEWYKVSQETFNQCLQYGFKGFPLKNPTQNIYFNYRLKPIDKVTN